MKLRALKAHHGDALILRAGSAQILIDGGPNGTYQQCLRDEIKGLDANSLDLIMVSHIDADHIDGILDLVNELEDDDQDNKPRMVDIDNVWHNSFADFVADPGSASAEAAVASAGLAAAALRANKDEVNELPSMVLSSVAQGRQLRTKLLTLDIDLNSEFPGGLVLRDNQLESFSFENLELAVLGPTKKEVDKLKIEWDKQVSKLKEKEAKAASAFDTVKMDRSVSNLASIVTIAKHDGKTALLTGDARGDMIIQWLEETHQFAADGTVKFDLIKLPHHGSRRNLSPEFFERVIADKYVISGDGSSGNPEPGVFEWLFVARPALDYKIYLTYPFEKLKSNKAYIKRDSGQILDEVFAQAERTDTLVFPNPGDAFVDIEI